MCSFSKSISCLCTYHCVTGEQRVAAAAMKDVEWVSQTCILGWPVQGIWPPGADGTDINAIDRCRTKPYTFLASADDFGRVRVLRYPCVEPNSAFNEYSGHSSHVTCVRWTARDTHLISTGSLIASLLPSHTLSHTLSTAHSLHMIPLGSLRTEW